jgi:acyl-CoA thioesterase-2
MRPELAELLSLLELERIEENLFRGQPQDLGWGSLFGGHVLGQALSAATQTAPVDRHIHSLHAYFLRSGKVDRPIVYTVDPIRDGRSFTTRRVVASQDGKAIFNLSASFQIQEPGLDHQVSKPRSPDPETLASEHELAQAAPERLPPSLRSVATRRQPIEIRPVAPLDPISPERRDARRQVWLRTPEALPDDPKIHSYLLAYASDFHLLVTAMQPHGVSWLTPGMQVTSLDHAMYFHRPFRIDDWLLYDMNSPTASGARGLVSGHIFDKQGRLVASTMQEGLVRDCRPKTG